MNQARSAAGTHSLIWDRGDVVKVALDWSTHMSFAGTVYHNPNYGSQLAEYRQYWTVGENVGYTTGGVAVLFRTFLSSAGHRENILRPEFRYTSVGCIRRDDGSQWVTQHFWG